MARVIQPAFARGEIAPDLYGRVDTNLYQLALRTARNVIVHAFGGVSNRPGLPFVGPVKDHSKQARLIPFRFKTTDTHILEFGHEYIRILRDDAPVTEAALDVTNVTAADPVEVTTSAAHGFSSGDEVLLANIGGMTEVSEERWLITVTAPTKFILRDQVDGTELDGIGFTAYTTGGTAARIYTVSSPYQEADLRTLKFTQKADVITIAHPSYDTYELKRLGLANWTLTQLPFTPTQASPTGIDITVNTSGTTTVSYTVTAISAAGEESLPGISTVTPVAISAITQANPAVVTTATHGLDNGDEILITGVSGMTELNGRRFKVNVIDATNFELRDINSTSFNAYTTGGTVSFAFKRITNSSAAFQNTVTWTKIAGADLYGVYREDNGLHALIGVTKAHKFKDGSTITPNADHSPPQERNPFFGADNHPGAIGEHEQRQVLGGSNNRPDTSFYSKIGLRANFTVSTPTRDEDAITATLPAVEVNQIRHYVGLGDLLVFTSGAEWKAAGSLDSGFSASTLRQSFQSNWGCSHIPPIVIGATVLFVLESGVAVRTLGFSQDLGGFTSKSISLLIPHLLRNRQLVEGAFVRKPDPLAYYVRDDGEVLVLSFEEEQQVIAWSHWDTQGEFESVATIPVTANALTEEAYFIVKRRLNGRTVRTIERTHNRQFVDVQDAFFVDSGLTHDEPKAISSVSLTDPVVVTTAASHGFANGDEIDLSDILWEPTVDDDGNEEQPDQLNGGRFIAANVSATTFELTDLEDSSDIDGTAFAAYISGGKARKAVASVRGLRHLTGEQVSILADGNVLAPQVVAANGIVTLPRKYSRIHIGLSYVADVETLSLEPPGQQTIQGVPKKIPHVTVKFARTRGLRIGPSTEQLVEMKQREFEAYGEPTALLTGEKIIYLKPDWNVEGRIFMRQVDPLPITILATVPSFEVGDL